MGASADMTGRTTEFRIKAGSRATLQLTVADNTGTGKDLTFQTQPHILQENGRFGNQMEL